MDSFMATTGRSALCAAALVLAVSSQLALAETTTSGSFEVEQSDIFCREYVNSEEATLDVEDSPSVRSGACVLTCVREYVCVCDARCVFRM